MEQIMSKLREAEVELSRGATTPEACRKIGVSSQTFYRWRKEYGGLKIDQAKRLKDLERENARLKKRIYELETEGHQTRLQLSELDQLYRTAPVGLCFMDKELRFVRINDRLAAINGHSVEEDNGAQMTLRQKFLVAFEGVTGTLLTVAAVIMIVEIFSVNRSVWAAVLSLM